MQVTENGSGAPNYFPNSFSGPQPDARRAVWHKDATASGQVHRVETGHIDNFDQCRAFFRNTLCVAERERLTDNLAGHMSKAQPFLRKRAISNFSKVDAEYGRMIERKVETIVRQAALKGESASPPPAALSPPRIVPFNGSGSASCSYRARI